MRCMDSRFEINFWRLLRSISICDTSCLQLIMSLTKLAVTVFITLCFLLADFKSGNPLWNGEPNGLGEYMVMQAMPLLQLIYALVLAWKHLLNNSSLSLHWLFMRSSSLKKFQAEVLFPWLKIWLCLLHTRIRVDSWNFEWIIVRTYPLFSVPSLFLSFLPSIESSVILLQILTVWDSLWS